MTDENIKEIELSDVDIYAAEVIGDSIVRVYGVDAPYVDFTKEDVVDMAKELGVTGDDL